MKWQNEFKTALVFETGSVVIGGAGSSVSMTGYDFRRSAHLSLLARLVEFKNTLAIALKRNPDYSNQIRFNRDPGLKEQFPRFTAEREMILNLIQQV